MKIIQLVWKALEKNLRRPFFIDMCFNKVYKKPNFGHKMNGGQKGIISGNKSTAH